MSKTLMAPKHTPGPKQNGVDGCHARWANNGMCPGVERAAWLNNLGEDHEPYGKSPIMEKGQIVTNGNVRDNWSRSQDHIVPKEPEVARLRMEQRRLQGELAYVDEKLKRLLDS